MVTCIVGKENINTSTRITRVVIECNLTRKLVCFPCSIFNYTWSTKGKERNKSFYCDFPKILTATIDILPPSFLPSFLPSFFLLLPFPPFFPPSHLGVVHDQYSAVRDKMQRMLVNHANRFELLQLAFAMTVEQHTRLREEMEGSILRLLNDYKADISITGKELFFCFCF